MSTLSGMRVPILVTLLVLALVVILPIYLLGYGIYQWGFRMTTDEITQSLYTRASFVITTLNTEFNRIRKVHQECLNDSDLYYYVNALSIMDRHERLSSLLAIEKRLALIKDSSTYIEEVSLWMPHLSQMISSSRGVDPATDEWRAIMDAPVISPLAGLSVYKGSLYLCAAYPPGARSADYVPQYVLAIRFSNEGIRNDLLTFNLYPDSGTLLQSADNKFQLRTGRDIGITEHESPEGEDFSLHTAGNEHEEGFLLSRVNSDFLNLHMYTYVSEQIIYSGLDKYRNMFTMFTITALVLVLAFLWFSRRLISEPVHRLVNSLKQLENGKLDVRIDYQANNEFGYLYSAFNRMAASLADMLVMNARQIKLTEEAELRQLQAQINPHFLNNCFFILYRMAKDEDYENISELLTYLSEYYRYITCNASMEVDLSDEDDHGRRYVQIQLVRFGKRIRAEFAPLPERMKTCKVPRLIIQPLLENAFQHGFKNTIHGGLLKVWYEEQNGIISVHVEDNGGSIAPARMKELQEKLRAASNAHMERSGIVNIHQRLRLRFGANYGIIMENGAECGARFTLTFPKEDSGIEYV